MRIESPHFFHFSCDGPSCWSMGFTFLSANQELFFIWYDLSCSNRIYIAWKDIGVTTVYCVFFMFNFYRTSSRLRLSLLRKQSNCFRRHKIRCQNVLYLILTFLCVQGPDINLIFLLIIHLFIFGIRLAAVVV